MDSTDTWTERKLAEIALTGPRSRRMLVGGLGLGYTAAELLAADVEHLDVVEIEDCLVDGRTPGSPDPRRGGPRLPVALHTDDVAAVLTGRQPDLTGPWDAILLDVDNGRTSSSTKPTQVSTRHPLAAAYAQLTEGGTLAIWCQGPTPDLLAGLRRLSPSAQPHPSARVRRAGLAYDLHGDQGRGHRSRRLKECGP